MKAPSPSARYTSYFLAPEEAVQVTVLAFVPETARGFSGTFGAEPDAGAAVAPAGPESSAAPRPRPAASTAAAAADGTANVRRRDLREG
ncbi:hypothetical protein CP982_22690 [Streptomyces spectabilis]|uniref:Uncharacterized protein n=1 Tax=Streptomyces spectabilis TaxID=68270 RepID=A0A5P2XBU4_STRST|nr:hypothetical protein CP982_22690 [Streptomyces spectabilis]